MSFAIPQRRRPVTAYVRITNELGHIKILRRVLHQASLKETGGTQQRTSGTVIEQSMFVRVYEYARLAGSSQVEKTDLEWVDWSEWSSIRLAIGDTGSFESLFDGKWSANFGAQDGSWIVDHDVDYDFPGTNGDGWYIGGTAAQSLSLARAAETSAFVNLSTLIVAGAHRLVRRPQDNITGSTPMTQHILLIA